MSNHSALSPSKAGRWSVCPGSVRLEGLYPEDTSSDAAREGTAAHWALAEVLEGRAVAEGQVTPDGFVLTAEMVEAAEDVMRWVHALIAKHGAEDVPKFFVEYKVYASAVHGTCWGTLDLSIYFPAARVLYVVDYKFGHAWVDPYENPQLLCYLAGMLDKLDEGSDLHVYLTIIQPRSYHPDGAVRTWSLSAAEAQPFFDRLAIAAQSALLPDAQCVVNPNCNYCNARHACPALQAAGLSAMDHSERAVPFDLPPQALGLELMAVRKAIKALEAREAGLAGQAESIIRSGGRVPFWSLKAKPGNLAWKVPAAEVITLGQMLGMALQKPPEAITPTQARDRGLDPALVETYAERPAGKMKLEAVQDVTARRLFS